MNYISTRTEYVSVSGAEAIVKGLAPDGGLFVPEVVPSLTYAEITAMTEMDYPQRAAFVMHKFLDEFSEEELLEFAQKAYSRFDGDPCPVVVVDEKLSVLELIHGPTLAFKDMALTILPYLLTASKKKLGSSEKTLILVATSGDTGKAALEGFKDVEGTEIIVFYPSDGVSEMQKLQMSTQEGENVHVGGIVGNFDDAQTAVKTIFSDKEINAKLLERGYALSSANSINWGRLLPQIVYYISAYVDLLGADEIVLGENVNFVVPTGNFGNILACYYARKMGLPVDELICASNQNKVLTDFFETGVYSTEREFYKTMSPSMDILVSSNLERLLFELLGRDTVKVTELMKELKETGSYAVDEKILDGLNFVAGWADEVDTASAIAGFYDEWEYLLDPHTAVAVSVYYDYADASGDETKTVVVSTANPYKFPRDVYRCLTESDVDDAFKAAQKLYNYTGEEIPPQIAELKNKVRRFREVFPREKIADAVFGFLKEDKED